MLSSSISAVNAAATQFAAAAGNIANASTPEYRAVRADLATAPGGGVAVAGATATGEEDLASDFVAMIEAKSMFEVNLKVLKSQNEMLGSVIDLFA